MAVIICKEVSVPSLAPPVGTTWLYEEDGTFEVPATGNYEVELHGGGGGAATTVLSGGGITIYPYATGGGSGQKTQVSLTKGETIEISIGSGGTPGYYANASSRQASSFGTYVSVDGGGGGRVEVPAGGGTASGNISTAGTYQNNVSPSTYGLGNADNASQTYGNGGGFSGTTPQSGQPGACIITFLGVN